ncbi:hypothetical protein GJU43_13535 [Flavobacterium sp. LC2016-23]|uniref:DoxX family protein n=1 Tax=Flavobacterium sp. LC2016-23 TaxID=2666330 RepID=UPI0012AF87AF|nr:hypothetical protein [Flavobacterium sp. LC2016-23]MRX40304.1 hypothetical protein [Flavobacterium sp. LC2016-23]
MKPLFILLVSFIVSIIFTKTGSHNYNLPLAGRIAMCIMMVFTAVGHFIYAKGMIMMLPDFFPLKRELVFITGILEILMGIGLLIPNTKMYCGWILIVFLLLVLPANINGALKNIDFQNGSTNGPGISYLWFRIPLQLFFIAWTFFSCIKY